ncbi:MAG: TIR domain-containing protein [Promethearchaeota archaeon]
MSKDKKILEEIESISGQNFRRKHMPGSTDVGFWFDHDEDGSTTVLSLDLEKLNLDDNRADLLGKQVKKFKKLEKIIIKLPINSNFLRWLEDTKDMKIVIIRNSNLTKIPDVLQNFKQLETLDLEDNEIESLPDWFKELQVSKLNLKNNKFSQLSSLLTLSNLKRINIESKKSYSDITQEALNAMSELLNKGVEVEGWEVEALFNLNVPLEQVNLLKKIRDDNGHNIVAVYPMESVDDQYTHEGRVRFNYYECIHARVWEGKIKQIAIRELPMANLSEAIGEIDGLSYLKMSVNGLKSLPESIGNLKELQELDLSGNHLSSLPDSFVNLKSLMKLNLNKNNFTEIPTELWALKELTELKMEDNPLNSEELGILQKVPDLIRKYLRKKATIRVFISHAVVDFDSYRVEDLVKYLESQKEISQVFFCEENLAGNIDQWMLDAVQKCQLILFIATNKSVFNSPDCDNELQLADKFSIPVIPIKGMDVDWPDLAEKNLSRELGLEFDGDNFEEFCDNLYKYIENIKNEVNLMEKEERKKDIVDVYERFRLIMDEKFSEIKRKIDILTSDYTKKISELEEKINNLGRRLN